MFKDLIDDFDNFSGQPDTYLDVPFVPSDERIVESMLDFAGVGADDVLYDLGSGDGRIVVAAARDRDARCVGIEMDPMRVADAMEYAADSRVEYQVDFVEEDLFTADFSEATVITLYLLDSVNVQLRPRLLTELRPGTRIVSHAFDMGDWKADDRLELGGTKIYKWIVPAPVAGAWEWEDADGRHYGVELEQHYQVVTGSAEVAGKPAHLENAKLCGNLLELTFREDGAKRPHCFRMYFDDAASPSVERVPAS